MAYVQKELSGSLFKNEKKTTDMHPNGNGRCLIAGVEYYVSAWTKEGPKGKWQSLAFKPVSESQKKPEPFNASTAFDALEGEPPF